MPACGSGRRQRRRVAVTGEVEALLIERDGYIARGRADRVAQVDAQLARHGIEVEPPTEQRPRRKNT